MIDGYILTPETAGQIGRLLGKYHAPGGGMGPGGVHRQVSFVKVTGEEDSSGYVPCRPVSYRPALGNHEEYAEAHAYEPNGLPLEVDHYYLAINCGPDPDDGKQVFEVDVSSVLAGCQLIQNETGLHLDVDALAGAGLEVEPPDCSDDSGDCCPRIQVRTICKRVLIDAVCNDDGTLTKTYEWIRVPDIDAEDCAPSDDESTSSSEPPPDWYCVSATGTGDPASCMSFASGETPDPGTWDVAAGPFSDDPTCGGNC